MAIPTSRETLKQWCLRKLGEPTIKVNVADSQVEDRIDEALQYFSQYHFDAIEQVYYKHEVTATDIANEYIDISGEDDIIAVTGVFHLNDNSNANNLFDVRYQARLSDVHYFSNTFLQYYDQTKQYINLVNKIVNPAETIRYNRHTNKIYIDGRWGEDILEGQYVIFDTYRKLDPDTYTDVYNDIFLKQYVTELIREQWAQNLSKYDNISLPGGVTMNADAIRSLAQENLTRLREEMRSQEPLPFFEMG